jgi:hypothetical protein
VTPRPAIGPGHLSDDVAQRLLDFGRRHASPLQTGWRVGQQRLDINDVARCDRQDRLRLGPVVAVGDRLRCRGEAVDAWRLCGRGASNDRERDHNECQDPRHGDKIRTIRFIRQIVLPRF